jgi:hypothetical protein
VQTEKQRADARKNAKTAKTPSRHGIPPVIIEAGSAILTLELPRWMKEHAEF